MADEADLAEMHIQAHVAVGLAANAARLRPETHPDFDGENCVECGDEIPPARLAMGKVRCTHCQGAREHHAKFAA